MYIESDGKNEMGFIFNVYDDGIDVLDHWAGNGELLGCMVGSDVDGYIYGDEDGEELLEVPTWGVEAANLASVMIPHIGTE